MNNQKNFEEEIINQLKEMYDGQKEMLNDIDCDDEEIIEAKEKLKKQLKNFKTADLIRLLFFKSGPTKRSKLYYAWWDRESENIIICKYGQKKFESPARPGVRREHQ